MEKAFKIIANSDNRDSLYNFIRQHDLDIGCTGGIRVKNHGFSVEIYASEKEAIKLQKEIDEKELSNANHFSIFLIGYCINSRLG